MNKKTLIGVFSHSTANDIVARHWPYFTLADCALWGIGRVDTHCVWPMPRWCATDIGKEGYAGGENLCRRLIDAIDMFAYLPVFKDFTDLCLVESDAVFTKPLYEHRGGLETFRAGGGGEGFLSTQYFHTPWWVDRPTAIEIVKVGTILLNNGIIEQGFPDRFLGLVMGRLPDVPIHPSETFSLNQLDTPARMTAGKMAVEIGSVVYVHGLKTEAQFKEFSEVLPDLCRCPKCGYWIEDMDGFGCLAHLTTNYRMGCGYCSHPNITDGKCGICGESRP